jgi:hypothetical protein
MMKREWMIVVAAALIAVAPRLARAQVYYLYPGAPAVTRDDAALGGTVGFGDHLVRLLGYGRFNINPVADLGLEVVLDETGGKWRVGAGADVKYGIVPEGKTMPFDLSLDAGIGFQTGGDVTNLDVPVGGLVSRPLQLDNGRVVVPYGGLYLVFRHASWDLPPGVPGDDSNTDLDVELRLGASISVFTNGDAFVNIHIGEDFMFFLGYNANI